MTDWALAFLGEDLHGEHAEATLAHLLAGQWYVPLEGVAACRAVAEVRAADTGRLEHRFVCDKPADHLHDGDLRHRQVTDYPCGRSVEWSTHDESGQAGPRFTTGPRAQDGPPAE
ncbi:hypothetical protein ACIGO9_29635 [Nocardia asteroides]|uniref:hypothetical protein n=1 Tax=Nocardia asteroides TaxID=1824 RepID=UPI0037CB301A